MAKKDLVLAEINNGNYDITSIAEKTEIKRYRVKTIIEKLILRRKIEGELNKEETELVQ